MDKQYLNDEFDRFFEFPTEDKSHVSSVSAKLFAEHIAYPLEEYVAELEAKLEKYENLEPVAWRCFDGEGGYDYRSYVDNENYRNEFLKRNTNPIYKSWVEPLYALEMK